MAGIDTQDTFQKPEPEKKKKKHPPIAVYLTLDEKAEIKGFAEKAGVTRHAFLQFAVRYFLAEYRKDKGILKKKKQTVLDMP